MLAASGAHEDVVYALLEGGASVAAKDGVGWTALHHAAKGGSVGIVHVLIAKGANIAAEDEDGEQPWRGAMSPLLRDGARACGHA